MWLGTIVQSGGQALVNRACAASEEATDERQEFYA